MTKKYVIVKKKCSKFKIFLIMIAVIALFTTIVSCGNEENNNSLDIDSKTDIPEAIPDIQTDDPATEQEKESISTTEITLAEQEVYNDNGIVVTVTGIDTNSIWGTEISVLIENNSDQNVTVQPRNSSINGYMIDFQMSCDIVAGKKANDCMIITNEDLEASGIDTISSIEFLLTIFDSDTWDDIANSGTIALITSASDYIQEYDDSGEVVYNENGFKIVSKGIIEDELWGPQIILYIENNTDTDITVQSRDTSVNGFMIDGTISSDITAGEKIVDEITFLTEAFEANGITEINEFEVAFAIFDMESWEDIITTSPIVISFK